MCEQPAAVRASLRAPIACAVACAVLALTRPTSPAELKPPILTVSAAGFQVDGRQTFLLGVSLFDALGQAPPQDQDLDALRDWGVKVVRVWAHWSEPIYRADGTLSAQGRSRLLQLASRLQARRLALELVLLRPGQLSGQGAAVFSSDTARLRAVASITSALRDYRNVLFDLYNEHDHPGGPISHAYARTLRDAVKATDPARMVTISSTAHHLISVDGQVRGNEARHLREEVGREPDAVAVDIVAPHFPRTQDWAASTGARIGAVRAALDRLGRVLPIYLNEERRAEPPAAVTVEAYLRACAEARQAGAAGWVFHTSAGFALRERPFLGALGPDERAALGRLGQREP